MATKKNSGSSKAKPAPDAALKLVKPAVGDGAGIDFEAVRTLARIAAEFDLSEIEADGGGHIRVRRGGGGEAAPVAALPAARPIALTPAPVEGPAPEAGVFISSPFVGTFYRAPSPEAPSFVEAGGKVRKGQVVCIVEAMKLMNEIEAEADGKVEEILVKNGEHVEYGQHLFRLSRV
jgi:acetyl-CoA carboxylase biotin carboxyl carrier protein